MLNTRTQIDRKALGGGILYSHFSDISAKSFQKLWPNFKPIEFACKRTGQFYFHVPTFNAIQRARDFISRALVINSAHRSRIHNALEGGKPQSAHLFIALDVSTRGHNRTALFRVLIKAGFKSFGLYKTFIHVDLRPGRLWFGSAKAKKLWAPILKLINEERTHNQAVAA